MDITKQIEYWKKLSDDDLETVEVLINGNKLIHALFFCHLSIEKILKALVCKQINTVAPKTHNLFLLANIAKIEIVESDYKFLTVITQYQLEGRYPDEQISFPGKETVKIYFSETKRIQSWLKTKL